MALRQEMLGSFPSAHAGRAARTGFEIDGVIASWWFGAQFDLKTLAARGFDELLDGWVETVRTALEEGTTKGFDPMEHPLVRRLLPEYLATSRMPKRAWPSWRGRSPRPRRAPTTRMRTVMTPRTA
jgi:type I restriction enzyme M protein